MVLWVAHAKRLLDRATAGRSQAAITKGLARRIERVRAVQPGEEDELEGRLVVGLALRPFGGDGGKPGPFWLKKVVLPLQEQLSTLTVQPR